MKNLHENMEIRDLLRHFDFYFGDPTDNYIKEPAENHSQWLCCLEDCCIDGYEVQEGDLILYDKESGQFTASLHPINRLSDLKGAKANTPDYTVTTNE